MLHDLFLLSGYFEKPCTALYEDDLIRQYGQETISNAIRDGLLEHRRVPCGKGRRRCICWLSDDAARQLESGAL